jgi:hypothetical protein
LRPSISDPTKEQTEHFPLLTNGYPFVIRIAYHHDESRVFSFSRFGPKVVRVCCVACAEAGAMVVLGAAMSEGMLASYSNSTTRIRRTWMVPLADLPSLQTYEAVLTSLNFASPIERGRVCSARTSTHGHPARTAAFSNGRNRLLNDDGVANADTPPSTSQTDHAADRHARAAALPLEI